MTNCHETGLFIYDIEYENILNCEPALKEATPNDVNVLRLPSQRMYSEYAAWTEARQDFMHEVIMFLGIMLILKRNIV